MKLVEILQCKCCYSSGILIVGVVKERSVGENAASMNTTELSSILLFDRRHLLTVISGLYVHFIITINRYKCVVPCSSFARNAAQYSSG